MSGGVGIYTVNDTEYQFFISDNADSYIDDEGNVLVYASRGYDYIIYTGYDENNDLITVYLTELSDTKGVYTKYKGNVMIKMSGFSWILNTIAHKIKGKQGIFSIEDEVHTLTIGDDGFTVKDTYFQYSIYIYDDIRITKIGDDWVEYQGWAVDTWVTVALIDITDYTGTYLRYEGTEQVAKIPFAWKEKL